MRADTSIRFNKPLSHWARMLIATALLLLGAPAQALEKITYCHLDALGSPVAATDELGNVVWKETYAPYGDQLQKAPAAAGNDRWYTGKPYDGEVGLSYFGARWYDPSIGRFMGVDSQEYQEGELHTFNRYVYGNNNPYRFTDPDGRSSIDEKFRNAYMGKQLDAGFGPGGTGGGSWRFGYKSSPQAMEEARQRAGQRLQEAVTKSGFARDFATKNTKNWSATFKSEGEARALAREKLGANPVEVEPGKLRSSDSKWQYRAKAGDIADNHIHLEELNPKTGEVLQNLHLRWPEGAGR